MEKGTVLGIRIRKIPMFLGLPDQDPLIRGRGPDPDPPIIKKKPSFLLFCDFFMIFFFEKLCKCSFKK
jgi:hypothetical protein